MRKHNGPMSEIEGKVTTKREQPKVGPGANLDLNLKMTRSSGAA